MYKLLVYLTIALISSGSHSQCDSLKISSETLNGIKQIDALNEYARCFMGPDFEKMELLSRQAIKLSESEEYLYGKARAEQNLGLVYMYNKFNLDSSLYYFQLALNDYEKYGDSLGVAKALGDIGSYYKAKNDLDMALYYYIRGLRLVEAENNYRGISVFSNNIGAIYMSTKEFQDAEKFLRKALKYADPNIPQHIANQTGNLAAVFNSLGNLDSALHYYTVSTNYRKKFNDINGLTSDYNNMTMILSNKEQGSLVHKAYIDTLMNYAMKCNVPVSRAEAYGAKAIYFVGRKDFVAAEKYYAKSLGIFDSLKFVNDRYLYFAGTYCKVLYKLNEFQKSARWYGHLLNLKDSLNEQDDRMAFEEMNAKFKVTTAQKESQLAQQKEQLTKLQLDKSNSEIERKNAEAQHRRRILVGIIIGFVLVCVLLTIAIKGNRDKIKANKIILNEKAKVDHQNILISQKNKEITDSINYAKKLQDAILPLESEIKSAFKQALLYYNPKDIVAGDFYWMSTNNESFYFAVADCTGHGVPGAMVSFICNNSLNRAISDFNLVEPNKILDKTKDLVIEEFSKRHEDVKDGMDVALIRYDKLSKALTFAGANAPIYIVRSNEELITLKPDKQPVGRYVNAKPFNQTTVQLELGDKVYLFTDGYIDQFGGDYNKKMKRTNFIKLLKSIQTLSMEKQQLSVQTYFEEWKGDIEQLDDVCVFGFEIV